MQQLHDNQLRLQVSQAWTLLVVLPSAEITWGAMQSFPAEKGEGLSWLLQRCSIFPPHAFTSLGSVAEVQEGSNRCGCNTGGLVADI